MLLKSMIPTAEFEELKTLYNADKINLADINLLEKSALNQAYKALVNTAYNNGITSTIHPETSDRNAIISRDFIADAIARLDIFPAVFSALKQREYIGVCGAGYYFESAPKLTEEEHTRLDYLNFDLGVGA